jgi:hypothetical protein
MVVEHLRQFRGRCVANGNAGEPNCDANSDCRKQRNHCAEFLFLESGGQADCGAAGLSGTWIKDDLIDRIAEIRNRPCVLGHQGEYPHARVSARASGSKIRSVSIGVLCRSEDESKTHEQINALLGVAGDPLILEVDACIDPVITWP